MLKQFKPKSKFGRKSVAKDIEQGMLEANEKARKEEQNKRVRKHYLRFV